MKKVARRELDNLLHLFKRIVFFLKCGNVKIKVIYYSKYQMLIWIFMMLNFVVAILAHFLHFTKSIFIHFCAHFDSLSIFFVGKSFVIAFYYVNLCLNPYFYGRNKPKRIYRHQRIS